MITGWRYRVAGAVGAGLLTVGSVGVANHTVAQALFTTYVPLFDRLDPVVLSGDSFRMAVTLSVVAVLGSLVPLFKPRPRRLLDTVLLAQKRVIVAGLALATLGYFQWSHRLPRATLTMTMGILLVTIPWWFVWIRQTPAGDGSRVLLVGDDVDQMARILDDVDQPVIGCLCPVTVLPSDGAVDQRAEAVADGGSPFQEADHLGGLSRIEDVLVDYDVATVVLAFRENDRREFFGALDACHEHGVSVMVHEDYAENVLTVEGPGPMVDVDVEPWDAQNYVFKRLFDVLFAGGALLVLSPAVVVIATAIKLDSEGSVFFTQKRTRRFGGEFTFYKFRTMVENAEEMTGVVVSAEDAGGVDPRVTRVGRILRKTHLDEIPQLWSILTGEMSVVGPRPAQAELEGEFESSTPEWGKRWFVKPGLTGLAQINDATGHEPDEKLYYDLQYIRRQSILFDLEIVVRQLWKVGVDVAEMLLRRAPWR